ncbi:imidazole glycerol phosphate synthase subunit HisH [Dongia rigui]|uniref:Imidazole glycerol phosphate synthase subunit HisH n=1 Tax=Dongia rigui TaxID=940149 RepID=A0ABU5DXX9_9PROT|nr:imidazole glycerol phosphate synthase subunit HisH [Dongia rigui]MDY0872124.1 imidazole glycerol phosphate synthase subunit HisH [Dongia rigui]
MTVAVIDYGAGNLKSAAKALVHAASETGDKVVITADADVIAKADRIVLPGVGAFAECKRGLEALDGGVAAMREAVLEKGRPILGICVGMQLLATVGVEYGEHAGLDWIKGRVVKLTPDDPTLKIPQMGWNDLHFKQPHPIFAGLQSGAHAYFVHSYHFIADHADEVLADVDYGGKVTAAVGRRNIVGLQFHPEKSQAVGLQILGNFLRWRP